MPDKVPVDGIDEILNHSTCVVLKAPTVITTKVYQEVIPSYSSAEVTVAVFYESLIAPLISHMSEQNVHTHIKFISESHEMCDSDFKRLQETLRKTPLVQHDGKHRLVSSFFDPKVNFFKTFYPQQLLPKSWHSPSLLPFLRCLGLRMCIPLDVS